MKWKSLLMPKGVKFENPDNTLNYARMVVEPLERGWGSTVGNALRRILLSSLQGAAVTAVKIDGALHEFTTLPGVAEDVTDIVLNIKKLRVKLLGDEPTTLTLDVTGEGEVKASDIEKNPAVEILNPDLRIATINSDAKLRIELFVADGRGYSPADQNKKDTYPVGVVPIDAMFSPVTKVNFVVESTRVGNRTDLDRLVMDIWGDGSISIEDAVAYASKIMADHLALFINFEGDLEPVSEISRDEKGEKLRSMLKMRVDELELSVRSNNCLRAANINSLADLVRNQETDMLKYKNFGRKSLIELNQVLANLGLSFGMDVEKILGQEADAS